MICSKCGGSVEWMGLLGKLTHTKCQSCGALNSQILLGEEEMNGKWDRIEISKTITKHRLGDGGRYKGRRKPLERKFSK